MPENHYSPVATIDLGALRHNLETLRDRVSGAAVLAVVKANAYGHGMVEVAKAADADAFGVTRPEEAQALREAGVEKRVVLIDPLLDRELLSWCATHNVDVVVHNERDVELALAETDNDLHVWLEMDNAMNRCGLVGESFIRARDKLSAAGHIKEVICMGHFASAPEGPELALNQDQLHGFMEATQGYPRSMANSAAALSLSGAHFDWVRLGLSLYGANPMEGARRVWEGGRAVMSLTARLIDLHDVPAGGTVGYGATWRADKPARVGTVSMGYADGYPWRADTSNLRAVVEGKKVPLVGLVSMDVLAVDLSECPRAQIGAEVQLWGKDLPVEEAAHRAGTIPYRLLAGLGRRVHYRYI